MKSRQGFTLIELLVVISIIGLLASIVIASLNAARVKARDVRRIGDLNQIRNALELFFDSNNFYPGVTPTGMGVISGNCTTNPRSWDCNGYQISFHANWNDLASDLRMYISAMPKDPINGNCVTWSPGCYTYGYGNPGRNGSAGDNPNNRIQYDLFAQLEDTSNPQRCGIKGWAYYYDHQAWCTAFGGIYHNQMYEVSPN